jgi:hypothetical protein
MKKLFTLVLITLTLLLVSSDLLAQSITIGPGQFNSITYGPMRSNTTANSYNRHAYIYNDTVLAGLPNGAVIKSVEFNRTGTNALVGTVNFKIYLKNTTMNTFGAGTILWDTTIAGATLVYDSDPTTAVGNSAGFKEFIFNISNFTYNTANGANLAVFVEYTQTTAQTATINWLYDSNAGVPQYVTNQTKYIGSTGTPSNSLTTSELRHPQIKINFPATHNMMAQEILSPVGVANGSSVPVTAVYRNSGSNPMSGTYYFKVFNPGAQLVYTDSVAFTNVAAGEFDTVSFSPFSAFSVNGEYTTLAYLKSAGDLYTPDDSAVGTFFRFLPSKPVVVSYEGVGTGIQNKDSVVAALNALGIQYDIYDRAILSVIDFTPWATLIWCEEASLDSLQRASVKAFLDAGTADNEKSLLIAGDDIGYSHDRAAATTLKDTIFTRQYLHFIYYQDDGNGTPDNSRICGVAVNSGLCDSLISVFPDGIGAYNGGVVAYRFNDLPANSDTVIGVAYNGTTYNTLIFGFEFREVVSSVSRGVNQVIAGSVDWIVTAGGTIPVELNSLSAKVEANNVTLLWSTATELNNKGFAIERKTGNAGYTQVGFVEGNGTTSEKTFYSFKDSKLAAGTYTYRLKQVDFDGTFSYSDEINVEVAGPMTYALEQNYPNPFNPATIIRYSIPVEGFVNLSIYNALGERVASLVNQVMKAGSYEVNFNATGIASGVYFYRIEAGDFLSVKKMMILK